MRGKKIKLTIKYVRFEDLDRCDQERMMHYQKLLNRQVSRLIGEIVLRDRVEKAKLKNDSEKETK